MKASVGTEKACKVILVTALVASFALTSCATSSPGSVNVPAPYTPVTASVGAFGCLGRDMRFGPMLLPKQVTSAGKTLLAAPIRLAADPSTAFTAIMGTGKLLERKDDSARWEWKGQSEGFYLHARMTGDCDGFCWYEITLKPKKPVTLNSLRLEIPRTAETARYLHAASFAWGEETSRGVVELGGSWKSGFMPHVWLGDEDRGMAWICESDQGWKTSNPATALEVKTSGSTVYFIAHLIRGARRIDSPISFKFGLQATPVKPVSFAWRARVRMWHGAQYWMAKPDKDGKVFLDSLHAAGVRTIVFHEPWTDYYGKVSTPYGDDLRLLIDQCHKRGMKLLVYIGYGVAINSPETKDRLENWSEMPISQQGTESNPHYRTFNVTCANSGWSDWLVQGIDKLFTDYRLDGLYFDGTSEAWRCQNEAHGCGWRDEQGKLHPVFPMLARRNLMRRIAQTVRRHDPEAILDVHMSASLTESTLSFCDSIWDGEQFDVHSAKDKFEVPLDAFRSEFMGWAHGLDEEFLCYPGKPFTLNEAIALAWVHGVEVRPLSLDQAKIMNAIWQAMDRFGAPKAKWQPYWHGSGVTAKEDSVKASAWVKRGAVLVFVSHLQRQPLSATLRLDRKRLSLPGGRLTAVDALTGKPMALHGNDLSVDFDGMTYRVLEIRKK
jgi:Glycoside hydrolase 123, N-terminal domain